MAKNPAYFEIMDSHEGKTTYLVGDVISNGCQTFFSKDIYKVCADHGVRNEYIVQTLAELENVSKDPKSIMKLAKHTSEGVRTAVAMQGYAHDKLSRDESITVRMAVAKNCNDLLAEQLIKDEYWQVRYVLAQRGIGLDILVTDYDSDVRSAVAKHGKHSEQLWKDDAPCVRAAVASTGYKSEEMSHDVYSGVRAEIAKLGLYLDRYMNDSSGLVLLEVIKHKHKLNELYELHKDDDEIVAALIEFGEVDTTPFLNHDSNRVRREIARRGDHLDVLVNDSYWGVRDAVAEHGYGLDILINDEDYDVRRTVERKKLSLELTTSE